MRGVVIIGIGLGCFVSYGEGLINEDFCSLARRERFLRRGILKIFRTLKNASNAARGQKDH
jgi:hypothetical protein